MQAIKTVDIEIIGSVNIYLGLGIQIMTALMLGGLIGYDREKKMKSAGIKTNILICLGATLYTSLSLVNMVHYGNISDPNRITAQIVSGIGFLGAGAIIRGGGGVVGLTTAATMWVVAAIGMTIGIGYPLIATLFTVTILVVLKLLGPIYKHLEKTADEKVHRFQVLSKGSVKNFVKDVVVSSIGNIEGFTEEIVGPEKRQEYVITFYVRCTVMSAEHLSQSLRTNIKIEDVSHLRGVTDVMSYGDD